MKNARRLVVPVVFALGLLSSLAVPSVVSPVRAANDDALADGLIEGRYARTCSVFVGQNKTGPYTLSYRNVHDKQIVVQVDGRALGENEFSLDRGKGTVAFKASLKSTSIARVDYLYEPLRSPRNDDPASAPVTLNLLQNANASLQLTALPGASGAAGDANSPLLVIGMSGKAALAGGGLTSQILFGTGTPGDGKKDAGLWDRAGLRLGYHAGNTDNVLDASFVRSGTGFAPGAGKNFGMDSPLQKWTVGARARAAAWLSAELQLADQTNLADNSEAARNDLLLRLFGTNGAPTLALQRSENTTTTGGGAQTSVVNEKIAAEGRLNKTATFAAQGQRTTTEATSGEQTAVLNGSVAVQAKLNETTAVSAQTQRTTTDAPGGDTARSETAATLATATKDKTAQASVAVKTAMNETPAGVEAQTNVQVKLSPVPNIALAAEQTRRVVDPADGTKTGTESVRQSASAELKFLQNTRLTGALARTAENGDTRTTRAEITGETQPFRYLTLAGGVIARADDATEGDDPDTQRVRLSVQPFAGWSLSGGLTINPEDGGRVAEATRQEFGLTGRLGGLDLGGGYALTTLAPSAPPAPGVGPQSGELSLAVGLRFSRFTQLTSSFKDVFTYGTGATPRGLRAYGLGLTHNLGSAMNFSLGGSLTQNKAQVGVSPDVKAEAKLGLKF